MAGAVEWAAAWVDISMTVMRIGKRQPVRISPAIAAVHPGAIKTNSRDVGHGECRCETKDDKADYI